MTSAKPSLPSSLRTQGPIATAISYAKSASSISFDRGHNAVWVPDARCALRTSPGRRGVSIQIQLSNSKRMRRPHSRGAETPELCVIFHPPKAQRAQGRPGARCTRGLVCKHAQKNAHEHTGSAETLRPSPRNGFTAYFALSPVTGFLATVASEKLVSQKLDASIGAPEPHDFAVRVARVRLSRATRPPHLTATFVTIAIRPSFG